MRRFAGWLDASLEAEARRGTAWVERLLDAFLAEWTHPPQREALPEYADRLREMIVRLDCKQRRVEEIADELRLRDHWTTIRRVRAMSEEEWRAEPPEYQARYGGYRG